MMGRRGWLFVAQEVGFWSNPLHVAFAQAVSGNILAAGMILRLREFVLCEGRRGQLPKRYRAEHIAAAVGFTGRPARLISELKRAGAIRYANGRGFYVPDWSLTPTGHWEERKRKEAQRKQDARDERRATNAPAGPPKLAILQGGAGDPGDSSSSNVRGQSADVPRTNADQASIDPRTGSAAPPQVPPSGGELRAARLAWVEEHYPLGIVDPQKTGALLEQLDDADWQRFQIAVRDRYLKNTPRWVPPIERCLAKKLFRLHGKLPRRTKREAKQAAEIAKAEAEAEAKKQAEQLESKRRFLAEMLSDADLPPKKREAYQREWSDAFPGEPLPGQQARRKGRRP